MTTAIVLASGPSMSRDIVDAVRGRGVVIAINDVYKIAPDADALVANDMKWWRYHRDALSFAGRKFAGCRYNGTEWLKPTPECGVGSNSGLQGMRVARDYYCADKILLFGFDFHGTHFFGPHPIGLKNTSLARRAVHKAQMEKFNRSKCAVINCTPGSMLDCFPFSTLEKELL